MAGLFDFLSGLGNMLGAATYTRPQDIQAVRGLLPQSVDTTLANTLQSPAANDALGVMGSALGTTVSFPLFHGSPASGLGEIVPSARGALGPGAYFTPAENVAARYGGNVYALPQQNRNIFNGLGDRYGSYEAWKGDKYALMNAVEPDKKTELQSILDKMWINDGYPMHARIVQMYGSEAKAQNLYRRAGFEGLSGHADGPEVVLFDKQRLGAYK